MRISLWVPKTVSPRMTCEMLADQGAEAFQRR